MAGRSLPLATAVIALAACAAAFVAPKADNAIFFENFQSKSNPLKQWVKTQHSMYSNDFEVTAEYSLDEEDKTLVLARAARHYGMFAPAKTGSLEGKDFVVQYEFKLAKGQECGGGYLKLVLEPFDTPKSFANSVPYSIMFGPDKCGDSKKVHFIFQHRNPISKQLVEHHLKDPPQFPTDELTHLYTLYVQANGNFALYIDQEEETSGSLLADFVPPVNPDKVIDDPNDEKPDDWVDDAKIYDPEAKKPADWDEDAPKEIVDEDAVIPEGWLVDEPAEIPDPDAAIPEEWDAEEDGEWEAPLVPNPKCDEVGCGEWAAPVKPNPAYKGKWKPPMIDNPAYKGPWAPAKIDNPNFFETDHVEILPIAGVGLELWTMSEGVSFDNILMTHDIGSARALGLQVWKPKFDAEKEANELKLKEEAAKRQAEDEDLNYEDDEEDIFGDMGAAPEEDDGEKEEL